MTHCQELKQTNLDVASRLRKMRLDKGLSLKALARAANLDSHGTIANWEKGGNPSGAALHAVAMALGTSSAYLLGKTDDPSPPDGAPEPARSSPSGLATKGDIESILSGQARILDALLRLESRINVLELLVLDAQRSHIERLSEHDPDLGVDMPDHVE